MNKEVTINLDELIKIFEDFMIHDDKFKDNFNNDNSWKFMLEIFNKAIEKYKIKLEYQYLSQEGYYYIYYRDIPDLKYFYTIDKKQKARLIAARDLATAKTFLDNPSDTIYELTKNTFDAEGILIE